MINYEMLEVCDKKIENWDGYNPSAFATAFGNDEVDAMIDWMECECPFDIGGNYFDVIERTSGYEVMREEVVTNYIRRNLMYMIDQTATKAATHWYEIWNRMYSWC